MAHAYEARILWERGDAAFTDGRYDRGHRWIFDGAEVLASSSPTVVPPPLSREDAVDPEEAFVASLSSCHMLFFLAFAAKAGLVVDAYDDPASGVMERNDRGKLFVSRVTLRPAVSFSGERTPSREEVEHLHHRAHDACFIASSVLTEVVVEPR